MKQRGIVSRKGVLGGIPVIKGTRVPVSVVASIWINDPKASNDRVIESFPHLTDRDVQVARNYLKKQFAN